VASRLTTSSLGEPLVTVVIPAFNAGPFITGTIRTALAQTISQVEVIVVDDGSTDATVPIVKRLVERDQRVRLVRLDKNSGVSAARNRGFALARGKWIAVLDSDDLMAPERLERLVQQGDRYDADIVADNLARFSSPGGSPTPVFTLTGDFTLNAEHYLQRNMYFRNSLHYGLLKPLFRVAALRSTGQRYNEHLPIAEDDDFYLRLLLKGLVFRLHASTYYFYRQHSGAVTQRIGAEEVSLMAAASCELRREFAGHPLHALISQRHQAFERAFDYLQLVSALKTRDMSGAARIAYRRPSLLPLLRTPLRKILGKVLGSDRAPVEDAKLRQSLGETVRVAGDPLPASAIDHPAMSQADRTTVVSQ